MGQISLKDFLSNDVIKFEEKRDAIASLRATSAASNMDAIDTALEELTTAVAEVITSRSIYETVARLRSLGMFPDGLSERQAAIVYDATANAHRDYRSLGMAMPALEGAMRTVGSATGVDFGRIYELTSRVSALEKLIRRQSEHKMLPVSDVMVEALRNAWRAIEIHDGGTDPMSTNRRLLNDAIHVYLGNDVKEGEFAPLPPNALSSSALGECNSGVFLKTRSVAWFAHEFVEAHKRSVERIDAVDALPEVRSALRTAVEQKRRRVEWYFDSAFDSVIVADSTKSGEGREAGRRMINALHLFVSADTRSGLGYRPREALCNAVEQTTQYARSLPQLLRAIRMEFARDDVCEATPLDPPDPHAEQSVVSEFDHARHLLVAEGRRLQSLQRPLSVSEAAAERSIAAVEEALENTRSVLSSYDNALPYVVCGAASDPDGFVEAVRAWDATHASWLAQQVNPAQIVERVEGVCDVPDITPVEAKRRLMASPYARAIDVAEMAIAAACERHVESLRDKVADMMGLALDPVRPASAGRRVYDLIVEGKSLTAAIEQFALDRQAPAPPLRAAERFLEDLASVHEVCPNPKPSVFAPGGVVMIGRHRRCRWENRARRLQWSRPRTSQRC
jgi:hypothetical protein